MVAPDNADCAVKRNQLDSPQMAGPIDAMEQLDALVAKGATRVTFHENGAIASVEFGQASPQHETPKAQSAPVKPPPSATGRLVPRVSSD